MENPKNRWLRSGKSQHPENQIWRLKAWSSTLESSKKKAVTTGFMASVGFMGIG